MSPQSHDFDRAPILMKLLFSGAGIALMLLALGLIPIDPARVLAPRWVLFVAGMVFGLIGVLLFIGARRFAHPAAYLFVAAVMCSSFAAIACWVAIGSTGPYTGSATIGPVTLPGTGSSSVLPRILFGLGALLTSSLAALAWVRWWRALRGKTVDLS